MSNPFLPHRGKVKPPKRNRVDLSRQSLFTSDWGKIYPFFLQECIPGDSFEINASVGFRSIQTKFPLQNRVRLSTSFFYVRNKNLWDGWEDWIFKTKGSSDGVVAPWLHIPSGSPRAEMLKTGGLADAFGLPTTQGSSQSEVVSFDVGQYYALLSPDVVTSWSQNTIYNRLVALAQTHEPVSDFPLFAPVSSGSGTHYVGYYLGLDLPDYVQSIQTLTINYSSAPSTSDSSLPAVLFLTSERFVFGYVKTTVSYTAQSTSLSISIPDSINTALLFGLNQGYKNIALHFAYVNSSGSSTHYLDRASNLSCVFTSSAIHQSDMSPYTGDNPPRPINALPFRAYESIMNYYFRNDLNSPYMLNGQAQYNEFIPTHSGGADNNFYSFHFHNWELDRFTSALQTPQFGAAPLVGLEYNVGVDGDVATLSFQDADDSSKTYSADLKVIDDKVVGIVNFSHELPSSNLQQLTQMVNAGFSINTLRTVNSFQRFLENCQRRGLRYRNQMQSHFGITVDYPDIDVPEYIGGFSDWAQVGQVTNMAEMPNTGLGDYIGTLSGMSKGSRPIRHYCPEHGFIIGVFTIYPIPVYSQACDKVLLKNSPFDYFQTEFGKIGFVPIHYSEISPLNLDNNHSLDDVFGYQRAWYDYLSSMDSAHGDFRTSYRDFIAQRLWDSPPVLSEDFVRVNPLQLNDIFTTRNIADAYGSSSRFLCSAYCDVKALRPIPVHGVPSLE